MRPATSSGHIPSRLYGSVPVLRLTMWVAAVPYISLIWSPIITQPGRPGAHEVPSAVAGSDATHTRTR